MNVIFSCLTLTCSLPPSVKLYKVMDKWRVTNNGFHIRYTYKWKSCSLPAQRGDESDLNWIMVMKVLFVTCVGSHFALCRLALMNTYAKECIKSIKPLKFIRNSDDSLVGAIARSADRILIAACTYDTSF